MSYVFKFNKAYMQYRRLCKYAIYRLCKYLSENTTYLCAMDLFPNEQNFDLDKSIQKFHHSLKEHHKISNIPKFRCEML
jgi:hypothetical protein